MFAQVIKKVIEKSFLKRTVYFFPIQLLFVHVKKNQTILLFWLILFTVIFQLIGVKYGYPTLFLDPEYLGKVNFLSFAFLGFAFGGFVVAFNIASYIRNAYRFPFLATLSNPFVKYCINNALLPILFILCFCTCLYRFQKINEFKNLLDIIFEILGFLTGFVFFICFAYVYFNKTNKDIFQLFGIGIDDKKKQIKTPANKPKRVFLKNKTNWYSLNTKDERDWHVESYISSNFKIRIARDYEHYDKSIIKTVYKQNYRNASYFQLIIFFSLILLAWFRYYPLCHIPAAASLLLILTMLLMATSLLYSFFRGWTNLFALVILILVNYLSSNDLFYIKNKVEGVSYNDESIRYNSNYLYTAKCDTNKLNKDIENGIEYLENWKKKTNRNTLLKPKLIIINVSGGGLRSTGWVTRVLFYADSILNNKLYKHTAFISGASGGLIGAAYWRERKYLQLQNNKNSITVDQAFDLVTKDVLNKVALTLATNDLFLRLKSKTINKEKYILDRGFALQDRFNENTNFILNKPLSAYSILEQSAKMPMLVASPTILNDGRRMIFSALPTSYLITDKTQNATNLQDAVEFSNLFKSKNPLQISLSSVLRMSASFPLVSPEVSLPTTPSIHLMDAGMRDNLGLVNTSKFIQTFSKWINQNTSGVVIIEIRDKSKQFEPNKKLATSISQSLTSSVESFYSNLFHIQDYETEMLIQNQKNNLKVGLYNVSFNLKHSEKQKISLSWHLTSREKNQIYNSLRTTENIVELKKLKTLLEE